MTIQNFHILNLEDQFGNLKEEYEIIRFEKMTDGKWVEWERFNSGRTWAVLNGLIHYIHSPTSLREVNMDFDSEDCGACYQVGALLENRRKIIGNEKVFSHTCDDEKKTTLTLHKQSYSDDTHFYSLQDGYGNFKINHASNDMEQLIVQVEREIETYSKYTTESESEYAQKVQAVYQTVVDWYQLILQDLNKLKQNENQHVKF